MALLVNPTPRIISIRINLGYRAASTSNRLITGVRKHLTIISITLPRLPSYWHPRNFISLFPRRGNRKKKNETKPANFGNTRFFFVCISRIFVSCHLSVVVRCCTTTNRNDRSTNAREKYADIRCLCFSFIVRRRLAAILNIIAVTAQVSIDLNRFAFSRGRDAYVFHDRDPNHTFSRAIVVKTRIYVRRTEILVYSRIKDTRL